MKSLCIAAALCIVSIQADLKLDKVHADRVTHHREICLKESKVEPALLQKARQGDFSDDANFRKHVYCVSQQIGYIDGDGNVVHDVLKTKAAEIFDSKSDEMIRVCLSKSEEPVERAVATIKCFYDKGGLVLV